MGLPWEGPVLDDQPLLWVDVETSGLDERSDLLLEVGLVLTDEHLRVVGTTSRVIGVPGIREHYRNRIHGLVWAMHEENGLFDAVERSTLSRRQVEELLLAWVEEHGARDLYMAGSGVHFDRRWLAHHMPELCSCFHYRNYDLTTLRRYWREEKNEGPHRAVPDLLLNVEDMRRYVALRQIALEAQQSLRYHKLSRTA